MELENILRGNSDTKRYACYILTNMWILARELKNVNKLKYPNKDDSFPLGKEKKAITSGDGGRNLRGKRDRTG